MKRFRYAYLLVSLVLVVFVRPFFAGHVLGVSLVDVLLFVNLVSGAYVAIENSKHFYGILATGCASAGFGVASAASETTLVLIVFLIATLLFHGQVAWHLLRTLFARQRAVTADTLFKAVSIYLLLGMAWTVAYALLELAEPGSFSFGSTAQSDSDHFSRFLGFSFTTLTTLGYGNVSPATPKADAVATLQATTGQIYLAVVIARLVAIQLMQSQGRPGEQEDQR